MSAPFMQLYVADYLGDTQHLTAEQHGAYLLLLMTMWRQGGSLPSDPKMLARIARVSPRRWHLIASEVMAFFDEEEGSITQKRLVEEYQKAVSKSEKRSVSGKAGGDAKALKDKQRPLANARVLPQHLSEPDTREEASASSEKRESAQFASEFASIFWPLYPEKVAKPKALEAFIKARRKADLEAIVSGLRRYIAAKPADRSWLNPTTFLNQERWADQHAPANGSGHVQRHSNTPQHGFASALDRAASRRELRDDPQPDREGQLWPADGVSDGDGPYGRGEEGWQGGGSVHTLRLADRRYG